jgi:SAM-dependent methyltransferase
VPATDFPDETRTASELRTHYEIEKELAARLRDATQAERLTLYPAVYDELFRRVESHPQLVQRGGETVATALQLRLLERYLHPKAVFLEIGAGDCSLALAIAERVDQVYAIDVSAEITAEVSRCENVDVIVTDGFSIPVSPGSVTLAYSNQLFEHLHPDDALEHLRQIYMALAPGGRHVCITPNRLTGPHDISKYFDAVATGLHLREYTATEVARLMRSAGFEATELWTTRRGISVRLPWSAVRLTELAISLLPKKSRRRVGRSLPIRIVLESYVVGVKAASALSSSKP